MLLFIKHAYLLSCSFTTLKNEKIVSVMCSESVDINEMIQSHLLPSKNHTALQLTVVGASSLLPCSIGQFESI